MWPVEVTVFITAAFIIMLVGCAIGAFIESVAMENERERLPHIEEERYWIKGATVDDAIPLPNSWTLSDAYFLRDLLRDKYAVGCTILYGQKGDLMEL